MDVPFMYNEYLLKEDNIKAANNYLLNTFFFAFDLILNILNAKKVMKRCDYFLEMFDSSRNKEKFL